MNRLFFLLIAIPTIEIFVMIKIGQNIGAFNTVILIFLTAITGIYYARIEGLNTLRSGVYNLYKNKVPIFELISGASIAVAAILLIIPGFITDTVGFLLLIPFTRKMLLNPIIKNNQKQDDKTIEAEIIDDKKDEL